MQKADDSKSMLMDNNYRIYYTPYALPKFMLKIFYFKAFKTHGWMILFDNKDFDNLIEFKLVVNSL